MPDLVKAGLTVLVTLTVTFLFNYFVDFPKRKKKLKEDEEKEKQSLLARNSKQDSDIKQLKEDVTTLQQEMKDTNKCMKDADLAILNQLEISGNNILKLCNKIEEKVELEHNAVIDKLVRLENREKNRIRASLISEYNLFTNPKKNPLLAWSEMEHDAFFKQVKDYEELGGNDYIHSEVLPAMNKLTIIPMSSLAELEEMFKQRTT